MGRFDKILLRILSGQADRDVRFQELRALLQNLGFEERVKGDHHILTRSDIPEILNLQPKGSNAKPYQMRQVRSLLLKYKLTSGNNDEI